jgi:hypothetical protein
VIGVGEGIYSFCDLSCKGGAPCPGGVVPWGLRPCELTEAEALALCPPGIDREADYARSQRADLPC